MDDRQVDVVAPQHLKHSARGVDATDARRNVQQQHHRCRVLQKASALAFANCVLSRCCFPREGIVLSALYTIARRTSKGKAGSSSIHAFP